jgi:hypothetical protein
MSAIPDETGHHSERCQCFDCFCAKQVRRVVKSMWNRQDKRREERRTKALAAAHDEMLTKPFGHACLPNLDYYDNRTPRREKEQCS